MAVPGTPPPSRTTSTSSSWLVKSILNWSLRLLGVFLTIYILILYFPTWRSPRALHQNGHSIQDSKSIENQIAHIEDIRNWQKPVDLQIIGLVFYGRREYVAVLDCYLKRNLATNGGVIDNYIFVSQTDDPEDLDYLETLIETNSNIYSAHYVNGSHQDYTGSNDYSHMWKMVEAGILYVKIDDDILFIEDTTIRSIVKRKIEEPESLLVSANNIVQVTHAWIHYHLGAIKPYLPELMNLSSSHRTSSWRASDLPYWSGPGNPEDINDSTVFPEYHRWLPMTPGSDITKTPIHTVDHSPFGTGWNDWKTGAQQHMSFLENLEKGELWRYAFDKWDNQFDRLSINCIAVMGDDVLAMMPFPEDDEEHMTSLYPKKSGRHVIVDGHGVAVHHGYSIMAEGLRSTDILDRYRAYAEEMICNH